MNDSGSQEHRKKQGERTTVHEMYTGGGTNDPGKSGASITLHRVHITFTAFDAVVRIDITGIGDVDRAGPEVVAGTVTEQRSRMPEEQGNAVE